MPDVITNRRNWPRYAVVLSAELVELVTNATITAQSSEVSRCGCYIDTLNPLPVGSQLKIQLRRGDDVFETTARVAYLCPGLGMGLNWGTHVAPEKLMILDRWLLEAARSG
jgi:PilZ domain